MFDTCKGVLPWTDKRIAFLWGVTHLNDEGHRDRIRRSLACQVCAYSRLNSIAACFEDVMLRSNQKQASEGSALWSIVYRSTLHKDAVFADRDAEVTRRPGAVLQDAPPLSRERPMSRPSFCASRDPCVASR